RRRPDSIRGEPYAEVPRRVIRTPGAGVDRSRRRLDGRGRLCRGTRMIHHQKGGARNAHHRLTTRTLGTHPPPGYAFEGGERGVAVGTGPEPRCCHETLLSAIVAGCERRPSLIAPSSSCASGKR